MTDRKQNRFNATAILFSFAVIALICVICGIQKHYAVADTDDYEYSQYIPTIEQLQQALTDTGIERYDPCGVDGNPGTKTLKAWKNWSFDQYAVEYFEGEQE